MGHGKHAPYEIPDHTEFQVSDAPILMEMQKVLQARGLSDPWIRNEVWRYSTTHFGREKQRFRRTFFTGFRTGIALTILHLAGGYYYNQVYLAENQEKHAKEEEKKKAEEIRKREE